MYTAIIRENSRTLIAPAQKPQTQPRTAVLMVKSGSSPYHTCASSYQFKSNSMIFTGELKPILTTLVLPPASLLLL
ncbi:MAG: hypothetical protein Q8L91_13795, partial [Polaromonas sp.]|nr:hypothetical protein [Polaromonas sp.]